MHRCGNPMGGHISLCLTFFFPRSWMVHIVDHRAFFTVWVFIQELGSLLYHVAACRSYPVWRVALILCLMF